MRRQSLCDDGPLEICGEHCGAGKYDVTLGIISVELGSAFVGLACVEEAAVVLHLSPPPRTELDTCQPNPRPPTNRRSAACASLPAASESGSEPSHARNTDSPPQALSVSSEASSGEPRKLIPDPQEAKAAMLARPAVRNLREQARGGSVRLVSAFGTTSRNGT
mgnify:CR=1 FL=1